MQSQYKESICPDIENQIFDIIGFDQGITPHEFNDHAGFIKQLLVSKTPTDFKKRLQKILIQFGFSDFSFIGFSDHYKPHFFLTSLPKELLNSYQDQHLYKYDLALDYLRAENPSHFHYSDIQQIIEGAFFLNQTFDKNQQILDLYKKFEFNDAYLMPYKNTGDQDGVMFSLMTKGATLKEFMALTESRSAVLHLLGDTAIRIYQNNFNDHNPALEIDAKPVEFLTTTTTSDLNLSQAADRYMSLAKKML